MKVSLYNRAEKYSKLYFWDYGILLTGQMLSSKEIKKLIDEIGVECGIRVEFPKIKKHELIQTINNENRLTSCEKQDILNNLSSYLATIRLNKYIVIVKEIDIEFVEKYLVKKGFYPVFLENTFKWII
jgi:hypothetical protein